MSLTYYGNHRAGTAEVRVRNRLERLRRRDVPALVTVSLWWAVVADRVRLPWRDLRLRMTEVWSRWVVPAGVPGIPTCRTCLLDAHGACGFLITDPACGCWCAAAQLHRIELATIEGWAT